jgi:hypothetical protein
MAGKGDTPRPVDGQTYRANWDAIFRKANSYPDWICRPCGFAYGRFPSQDRVSTYHQGTCDVCGESAPVTEPRDFGHMREWPIQ